MKARRVKGLDPDGPLGDNAVRIIATRLGELRSFADAARDPDNVRELHDMRIAAKRLRYVLEMTAPALGPHATRAAKAAKQLQDVLGDIHDCDEFVPRIEAHLARLRAEDAARLRRLGRGESDLDPVVARHAPNRGLYRGLETLASYTRARRGVLHEQFLREWKRFDARELNPHLLNELSGVTVARQDENPA